ncbi:CDGSH iron-sulfur domain-containing protein [Aureisphaera galaxeae]|uniref:CDGSH iron-sulfur domain-containing protein n=1 Tax=Aureisphaera galaxeae TaxID=1538023 RepID=UPI002350169D|nr:CDGSH iron-sulfur domain-containing protein [Aureisphaera galaxeae]MDC8004138.1 CDGSH iron-sulfur domain-containing protein [Aureisphaera galaxeae]
MEYNNKRGGEEPIPCDLKEGRKYSWCTCGHSENQPFCDGGHNDNNGSPNLRFEAAETGTAYLCTCKETKNPPYCDGSHNA